MMMMMIMMMMMMMMIVIRCVTRDFSEKGRLLKVRALVICKARKNGAGIVSKLKGEGLRKKEGVVILRGVDNTMHTMNTFAEKFDINNFTFNSSINI